MGSDMVSIKGTRNGLVIIFDPNRDFEEIRNTLFRKMESAKGFFKGAKFFFQGQHVIPEDQQNELENICKSFGLVPTAPCHAPLRPDFSAGSVRAEISSTRDRAEEGVLLVKRSLRSGQRVCYPGHVVIMGDIHPGAEIVAGGNILVVGICRGLIHAGAGGDHSAVVIAHRLSPTVISIADRRHAPENPETISPDLRMARLSGQKIVFEQFHSGH